MAVGAERRPWWVVAAMSLPLLLVAIDFYGLSVALPAIGRGLDVTTTTLQWTMNGFFLALAAPLLAVGRLGDLIGRRRVLLAGVAAFMAGSLLCGVAESGAVLIAGRCIQGVGTAMFFASSLSIVSAAFPPERRGLGIGVWSGVGNFGSAIGPLVGGYLTDALSWRWFFFMNVPVAVAAVVLTLAVVKESRDETAAGTRIDIAGFVGVTIGSVLLVLGIQLSNDLGWASPVVLGLIAAGAVLLAGFVAYERRIAAPLIDFALFLRRNVFAAVGVAFLGNFAFTAVFFFPTLYLQYLLELDPLETGVVFLAFSISFVATSPLAGALVPRWGERVVMAAGMALVGAAFLCLLAVEPGSGIGWVVAALLFAGTGEAFAYNISTSAGMNAVPDDKAGAASGVQGAIRQLGSVFGIAVTGAVFQTLETARLDALLTAEAGADAPSRDEIRGLLSGSEAAQATLAGLVPRAAERIEAIVDDAFLFGFQGGMLVCLAVALLGVLAALAYRREGAAGPAGA